MRPIIEINRETRELVLSIGFLGECGCSRVPCEDLKLVLVKDGCPTELTRVYKNDGCSWWYEDVMSEPYGVEYPLFEINDDGHLVFYFDDVILDLPEARYVARVETSEEVLVSFAVDLVGQRYELKHLSKEQKQCRN